VPSNGSARHLLGIILGTGTWVGQIRNHFLSDWRVGKICEMFRRYVFPRATEYLLFLWKRAHDTFNVNYKFYTVIRPGCCCQRRDPIDLIVRNVERLCISIYFRPPRPLARECVRSELFRIHFTPAFVPVAFETLFW